MAVAAGKVDVPGGLKDPQTIGSSGHAVFAEIQAHLKKLLGELQKEGAKRVTSRLNYSNTEKIVPAWAGTEEDKDIQSLRRDFEPGKVRFGRSNRSAVFEEAITDPKGGIIYRDWGAKLSEKSIEGYGPGDAFGPKAGCRHQLFIAIRIKHDRGFHHVGTITASFKEEPKDRKAVEDVMRRWATDGSPYVEYLKKNFNLGGPIYK